MNGSGGGCAPSPGSNGSTDVPDGIAPKSRRLSIVSLAGSAPSTRSVTLARERDRLGRKGRDGGEVCWQLARQALQKRHYVARFGVAQRHPELHPRHDADGLWKRRHRPVVKIGCSHRDIPQAGNTENIKVV